MPDLASLLPMLALLLVIGGFAGVVGGLLGVGGGIVLVPAFFYAFGHLGYGGDQLMQVCVATSMATIVVTSLRSVSAHNRKGAVDWEVLKTWGPTLVIASAIGTFVVFVYMWLPFMILPIQASIERIPQSYIEASGDLGASPALTFRRVILPLSMPGIAAGSIFTFSLTLGDYIIPQVIGDSTLYIGQVVFKQQGVAGNVPFAAAFSLVPIIVIGIYLRLAKKLGAFDAL